MNGDEVPMTEDQQDDWQEKIPPWLSVKTFKIAAALKMRGEDSGIDFGIPMKSKRNGDSMWFMLTDGVRSKVEIAGEPREIQHLTVVLCTPHGIFIEDNYKGTDVEYSMLADTDLYIEHLQNTNMRTLTDVEFKRFLNGNL